MGQHFLFLGRLSSVAKSILLPLFRMVYSDDLLQKNQGFHIPQVPCVLFIFLHSFDILIEWVFGVLCWHMLRLLELIFWVFLTPATPIL